MPKDPKDDKAGLARLRNAVQADRIERTWKNNQRPSTIQRTAEFCLLWGPLDTYVSFAARHPGMDVEKLHSKMLRIRAKVPGITPKISLSPWQIAQAYLASIPEHYRRPKEP